MENVTLLPADRYLVVNKSLLTEQDKKYLIAFYEPIIGPLAVSLYLTLRLTEGDNTRQLWISPSYL